MSALLPAAVFTWVLFIPIAITNGIIREKTYASVLGDLTAHQLSTVIAIVAFIALAYVTLGEKVNGVNTISLLMIGLLLVLMTMAFEFGFGHYVDKAPWEQLLADYNLLKGHLWGVFLFTILLTPLIIKLLKGSQ